MGYLMAHLERWWKGHVGAERPGRQSVQAPNGTIADDALQNETFV